MKIEISNYLTPLFMISKQCFPSPFIFLFVYTSNSYLYTTIIVVGAENMFPTGDKIHCCFHTFTYV